MKNSTPGNKENQTESSERKRNGFNREDSNQTGTYNYNRSDYFAKDKRKRIKRTEIAGAPRKDAANGNNGNGYGNREHKYDRDPQKKSYNPHRQPDGGHEERRRTYNPDSPQKRSYDPNRQTGNEHGEHRRTYDSGNYGKGRQNNENRRKTDDRYSGENRGKKYFPRGGENRPYQNDKGRPPSQSNRRPAGEYPKYPAPAFDKPMRLNRYLANAGVSSRREADENIKRGLVSVNGVTVTELGAKVSPGDIVRFKDNIVRGEKKVYIVMNKPKGFVTTIEDPHADKTVMDLIGKACQERVYPVGRLDKNSTGVLLITNDGELTKRLTHPSHNKKKIYQVTLDKPVTKADMEQITEGIPLDDGEIYADEVSYVNGDRQVVGIEIHSGRNRVVRRIFEYLGYSVKKLDRVYFAGLTKKNLKRGKWRFLAPREVEILKSGMYE